MYKRTIIKVDVSIKEKRKKRANFKKRTFSFLCYCFFFGELSRRDPLYIKSIGIENTLFFFFLLRKDIVIIGFLWQNWEYPNKWIGITFWGCDLKQPMGTIKGEKVIVSKKRLVRERERAINIPFCFCSYSIRN